MLLAKQQFLVVTRCSISTFFNNSMCFSRSHGGLFCKLLLQKSDYRYLLTTKFQIKMIGRRQKISDKDGQPMLMLFTQ